jgi:hypothetical protein
LQSLVDHHPDHQARRIDPVAQGYRLLGNTLFKDIMQVTRFPEGTRRESESAEERR